MSQESLSISFSCFARRESWIWFSPLSQVSLQMGPHQHRPGGEPPAAASFPLVTLQFLAVFGPVRLAPPQGASVVPRNTVHHRVCVPPLQHVQPGSQEGQVLSLACHGFLPSGFPGLHLRPGDKLLTFAGNGWLPKRLRVNLGMNWPPSKDTASLQGYLSGAATWSPRAPPLWGHSFFIPTIQQGQLPPVTRETCRAELGKAGTPPSHATEANKNLIVWGEELGVGKGKASKVGQGGGQGRTLAEPTARGLNACPWVCAGALWELCCDRPLGALGRFPPVFHLWLWSRRAAITVCVCATKETGLFFIWSMCPQVPASSDYLLRSDWLNPDQISSEGKIDIWEWFPPTPNRVKNWRRMKSATPSPSPESSLSFIFHVLSLSGVHPFLVPALPSYVLVLREIIAGSRLISSGSVSCNFTNEVWGKGSVLWKHERRRQVWKRGSMKKKK